MNCPYTDCHTPNIIPPKASHVNLPSLMRPHGYCAKCDRKSKATIRNGVVTKYTPLGKPKLKSDVKSKTYQLRMSPRDEYRIETGELEVVFLKGKGLRIVEKWIQ